MKILKFLLLISALFQFLTAGNVGNPTHIINGKSMKFSTNNSDNWYDFTMSANSKILIIGTDYHNDYYIYNKNI